MHKEIIISVLIIIVVIIMNIITQNYTDKKMEETFNSLEEIIGELNSQENIDIVENKYDSMYKEWRNNFKIFAYYIEHDELEKVELELVTVKAYIDTDYREDAISNAERAKFIIEHIEEKYKFTLKNIF